MTEEDYKTIYDPSYSGGVVVRLIEYPDGDFEVQKWTDNGWEEMATDMLSVEFSPPAGRDLLASLGVPEEDWVTRKVPLSEGR